MRIAARSPLTLKVAKESIRASERLGIEEGLLYERDLFCLCFSSKDKEEGVAAFLGKRKAEFRQRPSQDMPKFFPWWRERKFE